MKKSEIEKLEIKNRRLKVKKEIEQMHIRHKNVVGNLRLLRHSLRKAWIDSVNALADLEWLERDAKKSFPKFHIHSWEREKVDQMYQSLQEHWFDTAQVLVHLDSKVVDKK